MAGSPCGACKFLRRKCASECVFAPYFCSEQGPARFAAIHKVFGASNVGKLLQHLPVQDRCEAVVTISFEAQARVRDPVYGCVAHIFALQQQVAYLQAQVMQAKAQLENGVANNYRQTTHLDNHQWSNGNNNMNNNNNNLSGIELLANYNQVSYSNHPISPQSSLESIDQVGDANFAVKIEDKYNQDFGRMQKYTFDEDDDMGELQELALRMMGN